MQIFTEEQAEGFSFDVLDATKIVPEELVPVFPVGKLVLNRNPDNFFAETEQVAFCVGAHRAGPRLHQRSAARRTHPLVPRHADLAARRRRTSTRSRSTRRSPRSTTTSATACTGRRINRGRVAYEPNSLGGGCPFQAGTAGFVSFPEPRAADDHKVRGKAELFADHYTQATLFWNSQTDLEKAHIIRAFRFELSRVQTAAIRERMVSGLRNVAPELAQAVAEGLGMRELPEPMPKALAGR